VTVKKEIINIPNPTNSKYCGSPRCRPWRTSPLAGSFGEAGQKTIQIYWGW